MNLRDKLKAIEKPKIRVTQVEATSTPQFTDCWHGFEHYPLTAVPGAWEVCRETVALMQGPENELPGVLDPRRILYLDTETTGLMGGAGTVAFEVGLGWLDGDGFHVHQLIMRDYPEEKFLLQAIVDTAARFDAICTFNGKTFDVPLLRERFIMNRIRTDCLDKPHIDLLHIARRVWKLRLRRCNLTHLEEALLGVPRVDDLPGALVPERFFNYLKTGDFHQFDDVLEHNAQDIPSLCVLLSHMCRMYEHPEQLRFDEDVFSMGVALDRFRHTDAARRCYRLTGGSLHAQGQQRLAVSYRRSGEREEAARIWQEMIDRREGGVTPYVELAKHREHVEKDIPGAIELVRRAMALMSEPTLFDDEAVQADQNALQYRYERLKRKLAK